MIKSNNKEIGSVEIGRKAVSKVMQGTHLIWQMVKSCFGSGVWKSENKWLNNDTWKQLWQKQQTMK